MRWLAPLIIVVLTVAIAACGDDVQSGDAPVTAVATTSHVADLARNVGGKRVAVRELVPAGADPHEYEPRPSDAAALADAAVVLRSGGDIDEWLDDLIESAGGDAEPVTLIDSVETITGEHEGEGEEVDPHWWQDPRNAVAAVEAIRVALTEADRDGGETYRRNADRYVERLKRLDRQIAACIGRIPPTRRKIVTTHDALGYFAERYGVEVVGAVIPSLSTQAQPSSRDVNRLVEQIRAEGVRAIFPESAVGAKVERAIARESGAEVGGALWADSLGPAGSDGATYLESMASDAEKLASGMSGADARCEVEP